VKKWRKSNGINSFNFFQKTLKHLLVVVKLRIFSPFLTPFSNTKTVNGKSNEKVMATT
jgi:hypothetical protein